MAATFSYGPAPGSHERDRGSEAGLGPQSCDLAAGLDRRARDPDQLAELAHGAVHVLDGERESPEARGAGPVARHARALGRLDHLQDRLAGAKERLASGPARRGALAHAAQIEALRLELRDRPVEVRREHHDVIHPEGAVRMRPGGLSRRAVAERPVHDAASRALPGEPQPDARHPADAVLDVKPGRAPGAGLVGDLELVDARHARDATRGPATSTAWPPPPARARAPAPAPAPAP